jgi:hypothetical protein
MFTAWSVRPGTGNANQSAGLTYVVGVTGVACIGNLAIALVPPLLRITFLTLPYATDIYDISVPNKLKVTFPVFAEHVTTSVVAKLRPTVKNTVSLVLTIVS